MTVHEQFLNALHSKDPMECLIGVVKSLMAQGYDRQWITDELERLRPALHKSGSGAEEDTVLEVMDFLTGFSSPHMAL